MTVSNIDINPLFKHKFEHDDDLIKSSSVYKIEPAKELLTEQSFEQLIKDIQSQLIIPQDNFNQVYQTTIDRFAEFVQALPNLKYQNFNFAKGQLFLALIRSSITLETADNYPCPIIKNSKVTSYGHERRAAVWQYAIFTAALLLDIGRTINSLSLLTCGEKAENRHNWFPFEGPMTINNSSNTHYTYKIHPSKHRKFNHKLSIIFAKMIVPDYLLSWMSTEEDIFFEWLSLLEDEVSGSGTMHKLVVVSIRNLLNSYMGIHLPEQVLKLVPHHIKIKQQYHKDSFWKGVEFSLKGQKDQRSRERNNQSNHGSDFLEWLRDGLANKNITVNQKDSKVHISPEGVFLLNPEIFIEFSKQSPASANWQTVFKQFVSSGITKFSNDGNVYQYNFHELKSSTEKRGIIIEDPQLLFGRQGIPDLSPYISSDPAKVLNNSAIFPTFREDINYYSYTHRINLSPENKI